MKFSLGIVAVVIVGVTMAWWSGQSRVKAPPLTAGWTNASSLTNRARAAVAEPPGAEEAISASDREAWQAFTAGKLTYSQLTPANQARADQRKHYLAQQEDEALRARLKESASKGQHADFAKRTAETEDALRLKSEQLFAGLSQAEVLNLLGKPSNVGFTIERINAERKKQGLPSVRPPEDFAFLNTGAYFKTKWVGLQVLESLPARGPSETETIFIYSPHQSGKIHYNLGDFFQCLSLWFNPETGRLTHWAWQTPIISQ